MKPPAIRALQDLAKVDLAKAGREPLPEGEAFAVTLGPEAAGAVEGVARMLPDPDELPPGALLVVLPEVTDELGSGLQRSLGRLLRAFGRTKTAPRAYRTSALVARGYVGVGAGEAPPYGDLAWGYTPTEPPSGS